MAQFVPCHLDDGQVVYVNMDHAVTLWPRADRPGTLIKFVTGDTLAVTTPRSQVALNRTAAQKTEDQALWTVIRHRSKPVS
jgi:hypothetical protein